MECKREGRWKRFGNLVVDNIKIRNVGTFLVVQRVRLHAPDAGGLGSIRGLGTRSHTCAATKSSRAATKSLHATTKKSACCNYEARMLQLKSPHAATKKLICRN